MSTSADRHQTGDAKATKSSTRTRLGALAVVAAVILGATLVALTRSGASVDIHVTLRDYRFIPETVTIPSGELVTLQLTNEDDIAHDVSLGRDIVTSNGHASHFRESLFDGVDVSIDPARARSRDQAGHLLIVVPPGERVTARFRLQAHKAGDWEMGCFHSEGCQLRAGLHGRVHVD